MLSWMWWVELTRMHAGTILYFSCYFRLCGTKPVQFKPHHFWWGQNAGLLGGMDSMDNVQPRMWEWQAQPHEGVHLPKQSLYQLYRRPCSDQGLQYSRVSKYENCVFFMNNFISYFLQLMEAGADGMIGVDVLQLVAMALKWELAHVLTPSLCLEGKTV